MKRHKFQLPVGYRDNMSELDEALDRPLYQQKEKKIIYKNEIDWKEAKFNFILLSPFFLFSFLISHGSWWFAFIITAIIATTRTWRKIDDSLLQKKEADLQASKALIHMLMQTGQIKEKYTDQEIESKFEEAWSKKYSGQN